MLRNYTNRNLITHPDLKGVLLLDEDFIQKLDMLCHSAAELGITLFALKGFSATKKFCSCSIGSAIYCDLIVNDKPYTGRMLMDEPPRGLQKLVSDAKRNGIRWGGNFETNPNPLIWDSNFIALHPKIAELKYREYNGEKG